MPTHEKHIVVMVSFVLTDSQVRRLDDKLQVFARENADLIDKISLNKNLHGVL